MVSLRPTILDRRRKLACSLFSFTINVSDRSKGLSGILYSQGGAEIPTGGKHFDVSPRAPFDGLERVSRFGSIPKPTVIVRMKENRQLVTFRYKRVCARLSALIQTKRRDRMNQTENTKHINIAYIHAGWHADIVGRCQEGFEAELARQDTYNTTVETFKVPGALEIPLAAKRLALTGQYHAIVACGFVVDGGIYRHDFVASTVLDGMMRVQLDTDVPVFSAVLTPHQFQETDAHINFFKDHFLIKGKEAAEACLQAVGMLRSIKDPS